MFRLHSLHACKCQHVVPQSGIDKFHRQEYSEWIPKIFFSFFSHDYGFIQHISLAYWLYSYCYIPHAACGNIEFRIRQTHVWKTKDFKYVYRFVYTTRTSHKSLTAMNYTFIWQTPAEKLNTQIERVFSSKSFLSCEKRGTHFMPWDRGRRMQS